MTTQEAIDAMNDRTKVCGGAPGTEDYDEGYILDLQGSMAMVAWDSGVRTPAPIADLRALRD